MNCLLHFKSVEQVVSLLRPLPWHWVKFNTGGASKGNHDTVAAGGLLRSEDGDWIGGYIHLFGYMLSVQGQAYGQFLPARSSVKVEISKCHFRNGFLECDRHNLEGWLSSQRCRFTDSRDCTSTPTAADQNPTHNQGRKWMSQFPC